MSNETALVPVEQKRVLAQAKGIDIKAGVIVPTISQKDPNENQCVAITTTHSFHS